MPGADIVSASAGTSVQLSRRVALRLGGAALLGATPMALAPTIGAQAPAASPSAVEGDAFVGRTDRPDLLAAVVIGAEQARAYLCDGASQVTWLTGAVADPLVLASEAGDTMTLARQGTELTGTATLASGETVTLTIGSAQGIAGLYDVVLDGRRATGVAAGDLWLDAVVAGTLPDGTLLVAGAVALPGGGLRPLAMFASPDADGALRLIVLDDGDVAGAAKLGSGFGVIDGTSNTVVSRGGSFIDPTSDL